MVLITWWKTHLPKLRKRRELANLYLFLPSFLFLSWVAANSVLFARANREHTRDPKSIRDGVEPKTKRRGTPCCYVCCRARLYHIREEEGDRWSSIFFVSRGSLQIWCQRDCASLPFPPSVAFFGSCSYAQVAFLLLPPRGRRKD